MANGPNQSDLSAQALANLKAQNSLLQDQVILTNAINQVLKDNVDEIASTGSKIKEQLAKAGVSTAKSNSDFERSVRQSTKNIDGLLKIQGGSVSGIAALYEQLKITALDTTQGGQEMLVGMKDVANAAGRILKDLGKDFINAQAEIQRAVGGNAIGAVNQANQTAVRLVELAGRTISDYYSEEIIPELNTTLRGVFSTPDEYYGYVSALAEAGTVVHKLLGDMTNDQIKQGVLLGKAMDLNARDVSAILQRTLARQGEASNDMLENMAHFSKTMERETGIGAKVISEQMAGLILDSRNFANITEAQAAKASASLVKLGLDFRDLGSIASTFQGFDQAANNVANLTTAFGVQLDVMKMMHLANEDQGEMLLYLRRQFLATGKDVRGMSAAYKRVLMLNTGLQSIEAVEQLFNPTIVDDVAALEAATAEGSKGASSALEGLTEDIERVVTHSEDLTEVVTERLAAALAVKLAPAAASASIQMAKLANTAPAKAFTTMSDAVDKLEGIKDIELGNAAAEIAKVSKSLDSLMTALSKGDIEKSIKPLVETITTLSDPIGKAFLKGFESLRPEMRKVFEGIAEDIKHALREGKAGSMSPLAREFFYEGFAHAAAAAGKTINEEFNPSNLSSIVELRTLMPKMIKDGTLKSTKELNAFLKASDRETYAWSQKWKESMTPEISSSDVRKRSQSLTEGLVEAIKGGGTAVENYLSESGDKIRETYFKDIRTSEDVLANYSEIAKHLKPLKDQLESSGYYFENLTEKTQDALKPLMRIGGIDVMDLMKLSPKDLSRLEGMNKQFEDLKATQEAFAASGLTADEFFGGKEGEARIKAIVKQGQFASSAAAMAALQSGDTLDRMLAEKRSEFYVGAMAAANEADQIAKKAKSKTSRSGKTGSAVTVDISKTMSNSIDALSKSVRDLKSVKSQQQKIVIHLPKMQLGQTEMEVFAKKLLEVRMLDGKIVAQDGAGNEKPMPE